MGGTERRRRRVAWLAVLLALALALAGASAPRPARAAAGGDDPSQLLQQIQAQEQALRQLQSQMQATQSQLEAARQRVSTLQAQVSTLRQRVAQQQAYVQQVTAQLTAAVAQLRQTEADLASAEARLTTAQQHLAQRVRAIYEYGSVDYLGVLLQARTFADLVERFVFLQDIVRSDVRLFQAYSQARADAARQQAAAQQQRQRLAALQAQADDALQSLQATLAQTQARASQAQQAEQQVAQEAAAQAAASAQVQQLLSSLRTRYQRAKAGFALIWPVDGPIVITSPFGWRFHPILHKWEGHTGIDIAEDTGTPIHAAESGLVVTAGYLTGYGNTVVIDHGVVGGHDLATLYAHQSRIAVSEGQQVTQGQVIGYVGMTGWATGPHLHFEVRVDGTPVDPVGWLPPAP